jgi:hypothetical protein
VDWVYRVLRIKKMKKKLVTVFSLVVAGIVGTVLAIKTPPKFALSAGTTPIIPVSWTTPAWFIDPANSSGTASDSNNCTTSGTACLTWHEINDHRWGCIGSPSGCPRLQQNTTIEWLSSVVNGNDPVYFLPAVEGANVILEGVLPTGVAGTLANVTSGGGATRTALELASVTGGTPAAGSFLVNTTHASAAWAYKVSSGAIWKWSQPMARATPPWSFGSANPEVSTWANGDSVTLYSGLTSVVLAKIDPILTSLGGGFTAGVYVYNLNSFQSGALNPTSVSGPVSFWESSAKTNINYESNTSTVSNTLINSYFNNALNIISQSAFPWIQGGVICASGSGGGLMSGVILDGDVIFVGTATNNNGLAQANTANNLIGTAYCDTNQLGIASGETDISVQGYSAAVLWGSGGINVHSNARLTYPTGAGAAVAALKITTIDIEGQTKSCTGIPGNSLTTLICNITASATNLDSNLGTVTGCLFAPGAGSICNY